ncbi:hypothetical protein ACPA9J_33880 [Pseudomonas aeruginosa]
MSDGSVLYRQAGDTPGYLYRRPKASGRPARRAERSRRRNAHAGAADIVRHPTATRWKIPGRQPAAKRGEQRVADYNRRKEPLIRAIYARVFAAAGF